MRERRRVGVPASLTLLEGLPKLWTEKEDETLFACKRTRIVDGLKRFNQVHIGRRESVRTDQYDIS